MKRTIVAKFGGTSLADSGNVGNVLGIIRANPEIRCVVVSAPGRRFKGDVKITDQLIGLIEARATERLLMIADIRSRFMEIAASHAPSFVFEREFDDLERELELPSSNTDYIESRGEYCMARVLAAALGWKFVDAAQFIRLDMNGNYKQSATESAFARLQFPEYSVVPGFYGASSTGQVRTLPRNGSDISGAILARLLYADTYENWTDTDGVLSADPTLFPNAKVIATMTREELGELTGRGASVLHGASLIPLEGRDAVVRVRNTRNPFAPGTFIVPDASTLVPRSVSVAGVSGKRGLSVLSVRKLGMGQERNFLAKLFGVFGSMDINIVGDPGGMSTHSVIFDDGDLLGREEELIAAVADKCDCPPPKLERKKLALLCIVGETMKHRHGVAGTALTTLASIGVNVRTLDQGASETSMVIGVDDADYEKALHAFVRKFSLEA